MRHALLFFLLFSASRLYGQGVPFPDIQQQQFAATGVPNAAGFVCTYAAGTTTPLATYSNVGLTTDAHNPIQLNAAGRPVAWNTSTEIEVFAQARSYKVVVHAAGTGSTCNGTTVGAAISTRDNIQPANIYTAAFATKLDDKVCHASQYTGTTPNDAGGKWAACIAALPSTGGTVDMRGLEGAQVISANPFTGVTKCVKVLIGATTFTVSALWTIPSCSSVEGVGRASKFVSSSSSAPSAEMVTLGSNGDYASIKNVWLAGSGQVTNTADTHRGIWMGNTDHATLSNRLVVEGVYISGFTGNGISCLCAYSSIIGGIVYNTTDAGIFIQPTANHNDIRGTEIYDSRYSGIDINGDDNRVIDVYSHANGGGTADQASWSGLLIAYTTGTHGSRNIVEASTFESNKGCGVRIYGMAASGTPRAPYGNFIGGGSAKGQTTAYTDTTPTQTEWSGGYCVLGGDSNRVSSTTSEGNVLNYVVTGYAGVLANIGTILTDNHSIVAVTNAALTGAGKPAGVGFLFPGGTRIDGAGAPSGIASEATIVNNWDRGSVADSFLWSLTGGAGTWSGWTIRNNHSDNAGTYGFRVANASSWVVYSIDCSNYAVNASTANYLLFPNCTTATVTQGTDKTTAVSAASGAISGNITLHTGAGADALNACCGAGSSVTFTLNADQWTTARDQFTITQRGGPGIYSITGKDSAAGQVAITVQSLNAAGRDDAIIADWYINKR